MQSTKESHLLEGETATSASPVHPPDHAALHRVSSSCSRVAAATLPMTSTTHNNNNNTTSNHAYLNDKLLSEYTDVPVDDQSCGANVVRNICRLVAYLLTPRQVLGIIRVLKAVTFCFLILNIVSNGMYIVFVHVMGTHAVKVMAGGVRDTVIRTYGLALCVLALAVEVDVSKIVKKFSGLKGFLPRSLFMFLIASITSSHPIYDKSVYKALRQYYSYSNQQQQQQQYADDDYNANNQDDGSNSGGGSDDAFAYWATYDPSSDIPSSAVNFQLVTSFVLALCAFGYLFCGLICLDRFTTRAFLAASTQDPCITTAIVQPPNSTHHGGSNTPPQATGSTTTTATTLAATTPIATEAAATASDGKKGGDVTNESCQV